jgi:hypothetical protein
MKGIVMTDYKVTFPFIPSMGSVAPIIATDYPMESARENALWHLNRMRDHDGLPHLTRLPAGTKLERLA